MASQPNLLHASLERQGFTAQETLVLSELHRLIYEAAESLKAQTVLQTT